MPRRMGELRQLSHEWHELVTIARDNYVAHPLILSDGRKVRVQPIKSFHMAREEARDRVLLLRARVAQVIIHDDGTVSLVPALDQSFGIELENYMPRGMSSHRMAELISERGVTCRVEGNPHVRAPYWTIVRDGSLHGGGGIEVRSPFPPLRGERGLSDVRKVCSILTEQNCRVNVTTGLHVHVDARNRDVNWFKNLFRIYKKWERAIDSFMARSRRGSHGSYFCQNLTVDQTAFEAAESLAQVRAAVGQGGMNWRSTARYKKLNFLSYIEFGTVEFRQHQGTVEPHKTEMWTRMLLRMTDRAATTSREQLEGLEPILETLLHFLDLDQTERSYFVERRDHFAQLEMRP